MLQGRLVNPLPNGQYSVSIITELELLSYSGITPTEEARIRKFLGQVLIVNITYEVKEATIALRRNNRLKLPDAIIAATAECFSATLLTNDTMLLNLTTIQSQSVPFI